MFINQGDLTGIQNDTRNLSYLGTSRESKEVIQYNLSALEEQQKKIS